MPAAAFAHVAPQRTATRVAALACTAALMLAPSVACADETGSVADSIQQTAGAVGETASQAAAKFTKLVQTDPWVWGHMIAAGLVIVALLLADVIRPGSLDRAGKRSVDPHSPLLWFSCALLIAGAQIIGGAFAQFLPDAAKGSPGSTQYTTVLSGLQYLTAFIVALILARLIAGSSKGAGLAFTARSLAWGTMAGLLAWPVVIASSFGFILLHQQVTGQGVQQVAHPTLQMLLDNRNDVWAWSLAALAIIAAPIVEEIVYRGFVQSAVLKATARPWTSIFITSIIFALAHALPAIFVAIGKGQHITDVIPWYSAATVGVLGLCMGIAFERTKEIGVPITMHVIFNGLNVLLALVLVKG